MMVEKQRIFSTSEVLFPDEYVVSDPNFLHGLSGGCGFKGVYLRAFENGIDVIAPDWWYDGERLDANSSLCKQVLVRRS